MATRKEAQREINGHTLHSAVTWILETPIFDNLRRHGNTRWIASDLVVMAVVWVWSDKSSLTDAFAEAYRWSQRVLGKPAVKSYQVLTAALTKYSSQILPLIWHRLQSLMEEHGGSFWRVGGWVPIAVDGSRNSTPRTQKNETAFCAPNYGGSKTAALRRKKKKLTTRRRKRKKQKWQPVKPQIWVTLLWHMGLRLSWRWKTGPSHASERHHFGQLIDVQEFPAKTLFCGDAGFVGYEWWKKIIDLGHSFLIRVGSNVTLLRNLGYVRERDGLVYCWTEKAARNKQPPLVLRLLRLQVGSCQVYLVTNVLDQKQLSAALAIRLYQLRWGIEMQFRTLKQTFGRGKLRSRTPEHVLMEFDWSLLGLTMIQLFAVKEQIEIGEPPQNSSAALAIRVIRDVYHNWSDIPSKGETLVCRLRTATKDLYQRTGTKRARYHPDSKDKPSAGKPTVVNASRRHKAWLKQYLAAAV